MIFSPHPISPLEISSLEFSPHDIFAAIFFAALNFAAGNSFPSENTFSWISELRISKTLRRYTGFTIIQKLQGNSKTWIFIIFYKIWRSKSLYSEILLEKSIEIGTRWIFQMFSGKTKVFLHSKPKITNRSS